MGLQLWYSKITGNRRKGTTFSELQDIFIDNITTKFIYEPLACCEINDSTNEVKNLMTQKDFDILGVTKDNNAIGYIRRKDLDHNSVEQYLQFNTTNIISDSTPIAELFDLLSEKGYIFVLVKNKVDGIVTKADINKPIVRIYLFGIISLFELNLNYWINEYYDTATKWEKLIKKRRFEIAQQLFKERQGQNLDLSILECLQLCDKREILRQTDAFLEKFKYSKSRFKEFVTDVEKVRNEIAHSQSSIIANLPWERFVSTINDIKSFLSQSEIEITK